MSKQLHWDSLVAVDSKFARGRAFLVISHDRDPVKQENIREACRQRPSHN